VSRKRRDRRWTLITVHAVTVNWFVAQTWFQNHRSRAKQSLKRLAGATTTTTTTVRAQNSKSDQRRAVPTHSSPPTTSKRRRVPPPGECDETNANLSRLLHATRHTFVGALLTPAQLESAIAADGDDVQTTKNLTVTKKIRHFSNFYRQPDPGEVFVGCRAQVNSACSQMYNDQMPASTGNSRLSLNSLFHLNGINRAPLLQCDPSLCNAHLHDHTTTPSFPLLLDHVTTCDIVESSLWRQS